MNLARSSRPNRSKPVKPPNYAFRVFGGLKVRHKLALLHNVFFFVLAVSVYLSVIPLFSSHLDFVEGPANKVGLTAEGERYLREHPDAPWLQAPATATSPEMDTLIRNTGTPGIYKSVSVPNDFRDRALAQARVSLFLVLGTIYLLSIVVLEFIIMPQYVYQPLTLMLKADEATQQGDRQHEMIGAEFILNDEIGQIMHSRNATVAQLRQQEDDLASALQKLEEQDRLVSLGLLSTSVAHELNTPLAVLQGSIEKLLETKQDGHTIERLQRMLRVTQRLRKISEGLVDFARVRTHQTETVALRPLIDESWSLVAIDEKASAVTFENEVASDDAVTGNADRLVQVFVNLLRNALLAVSGGGVIRVKSKPLQRAGQNWICCTVLDDGPGIPADILPNLFEAFVTTRLDAQGTGLGLTVAEGIVTQHGGTISASNRPQGGASLEVILPAA